MTQRVDGVEPIFTDRIQALRDRYPYQFARVFANGLSIEPGWQSVVKKGCADKLFSPGHYRLGNKGPM